MAAFYARHHDRISRQLLPAGITLANVRTMRPLKDHEKAHEQPEEAPTLNEKDMVRTFDAIDSYLRSYLGEKKVPLAYVTREVAEVTAETDDPATNYATVEDEMISRSPHVDPLGVVDATYAADNRKVWEILANICRETNAWTWIKPQSCSKDGRAAYLALYNHYLGASNADNIQAKA
jgi:hypothetical protein